MKDSTGCGNDTVKATKHRQRPLDAALLCNKLEDHQREQEAARLRREKRDAVRNGTYVPRSAAKSFAATSTPMGNFTNLPKGPTSKRRSAPPHFIAEPLTIDGRICIPLKQRYAALNFGIGNSDEVGVSESEDVSPIKPHRGESVRDVRRDLKKLEEQFPYRPAKKVFDQPMNPAVAQRKVSLPENRRPVINERRSSIQAAQVQRSKSMSTGPVQAVVEEAAAQPERSESRKLESAKPEDTVPSLPRDVSPLRADEMELAQGAERWPSINQDENIPMQVSMQDTQAPEEFEEHGISLMQALNMDLEHFNETEHSSFKWDQYDPFKPQTRGSVKSEKHASTRLPSKRDSMNPVQSDGPNGNTSEALSTPHRRRSSPRNSPSKHTSPSHAMQDRGRQRYRPGDAAKRRTMGEPPAPVPWPVGQTSAKGHLRPASFHAITESRLSRFVEEEVSLDAPIPEVDEHPTLQQRPKLVPHDRPDWSQVSENGDDFRHTLNSFFPRPGRKAAQPNRHSSILAPFAEPKAPSPKKYTGPQNDHMIADAVKKIQQQERTKRRESVIGFFKKL